MKYVCQICGYIYDEEKEGIAFNNLAPDWICPLCGASKAFFEAESNQELRDEELIQTNIEWKEQELSSGQLAALCSNLARGAQKQYKEEEEKLFQQLADYFTAKVPRVADADLENLADALRKDIREYANTRAVVDAQQDRGAARVCVWGEKVTRMLASLLDRYANEGENMKDTNVWVCSVCGFVYVGDQAPALCPVCKVPDWKFEKMEGRSS